jgi:beta-lactamase regulating signal transducer with metallopeptidase domain
VWLLGFSIIVVQRWLTWRRTIAAVRAGTLMHVRVSVPGLEVRSISGLLEPGVVGWRRPVLLLPADLAAHLTPAQLDAVVEHEVCHVRRRDNLTAVLHMTVEALFWFHPFVWWIGGRLVAERERACDEAVVGRGHDGTLYAEAILKTCARYLASPLACVSGVTSSNLRHRLEHIVAGRVPVPVNVWKRCVLSGAALLVVTIPLAAGVSQAARVAAAQRKTASGARFDVASIRVNPAGRDQPTSTDVLPGGRDVARNKPLQMPTGEAFDVPHLRLLGGPDLIASTHFDIDAKCSRELYATRHDHPL